MPLAIQILQSQNSLTSSSQRWYDLGFQIYKKSPISVALISILEYGHQFMYRIVLIDYITYYYLLFILLCFTSLPSVSEREKQLKYITKQHDGLFTKKEDGTDQESKEFNLFICLLF